MFWESFQKFEEVTNKLIDLIEVLLKVVFHSREYVTLLEVECRKSWGSKDWREGHAVLHLKPSA